VKAATRLTARQARFLPAASRKPGFAYAATTHVTNRSFLCAAARPTAVQLGFPACGGAAKLASSGLRNRPRAGGDERRLARRAKSLESQPAARGVARHLPGSFGTLCCPGFVTLGAECCT